MFQIIPQIFKNLFLSKEYFVSHIYVRSLVYDSEVENVMKHNFQTRTIDVH